MGCAKVEAGVVRVLSELSTSYKEKNQLYCARALCNLACHHGSEKSLVEGGGVSALMMIALVRAGEIALAAGKIDYTKGLALQIHQIALPMQRIRTTQPSQVQLSMV